MSISVLVVLHEATRTGAPRVGGLIASALKKHMDVRVLCLSDGPLVPWLNERVGSDNVTVLDYQNERHRRPFDERVTAAVKVLAGFGGDLVYINSVAASEFVVAAKSAGYSTVLHVHEKADMLRRLFEIDLTKSEVLALSDAVVLAASSLRSDVTEVFGFLPEPCLDFGIAVDAEEIARLATEEGNAALNASGEKFRREERLVVGMCGHASLRKGADIFFAAASALSKHDFLWIGNWSQSEAPENPAFGDYSEKRLPNLYVTGGVDNPYKYLAQLDVFFLSSREDPNPLVLAEALTLGVPIFAFGRTTGVTEFLGRSGILCHGAANTEDAVRVLRGLNPVELRSSEFLAAPEGVRTRFDISAKIDALVEFLACV